MIEPVADDDYVPVLNAEILARATVAVVHTKGLSLAWDDLPDQDRQDVIAAAEKAITDFTPHE